MATINFHSQFLAPTLILIHVVNSTIQATNHGFEIDLIHRDSPNSPLYNPNRTPLERYNDAFRRAYSRLNRLNQFCNYTYGYADSSLTKGVLSTETIIFGSSSGNSISFNNIVFGCGHNNTGTFNENEMGLIGTGVVSTPLVPKDGKITFYFVTLEGISVGDKFIPYNSSQPISKGNMLIDSGTPPTLLHKDFNKRLEYEVRAHFDGDGQVPLIKTSTFIPPLEGVFCFAMQPIDDGDDVGIFGNFDQSSLLIDYDLDKQIVSFMPADCTKQH
ncbi:hypothetical protein QYF36_008969 [Acer negundo]|nr:hypothetical protein QYF36_008969 [Acer negundo]